MVAPLRTSIGPSAAAGLPAARFGLDTPEGPRRWSEVPKDCLDADGGQGEQRREHNMLTNYGATGVKRFTRCGGARFERDGRCGARGGAVPGATRLKGPLPRSLPQAWGRGASS